ncbi:MAG: hypothetical protein ACPHQ9_12255, partial [Marinobacter sp.]|uniref:hypothetical protein n=1 Tax=Marinobacter sp. TaxID=50741 RepID=UPI003C47330E
GGYVIASLLFKEINFSEISRLALVGLSVFVLLIVFLSEALFDPRSAGLVWNPISGFASLFEMLRSEKQAIVIFMDADFGLLGSPYRGLVLAALTFFSLSIGISMRDSGLTKAAAFCILSVFLSLIMAFGIVPSGLSIDFGRWFLWSLQAMVFLVFFIAVYKVQKGSKLFLKILFSIIVFSMFFFGVFQAVKDFTTYKSVNKAQAVSYQELTSMMNAVEEATRGSKCSIISDSKAFPERLIVVQSSKVWEYAESATACKFLNGSWMQPGLVGAREIGGLPSMKVLETALTEDSVIFVGGLKKLKDYLSIMSRKGLNVDADSLGVVGGVSVFRLRLNE